MKIKILIGSVILSGVLFAQNPLFIPSVLTGTTFNLNIQNGVTQFLPSINTPTYGINGPLLAPTLIVNKWDTVTLNVTNNLTGNGNSTTMHWHGFHVPAIDDGGPHQIIAQNSTWSPSFQILNNAGTYWYHPHGDGKTDLHVSKGLAGMIIVKDSAENALVLPRTYGVDDFPLIIQTKSFDVLNQIAVSTSYDTLPMVNGTVDPYLDAPAQVVRFRVLNGASERSFMLGFSNNMNFQVIASDGGLLDSSVTMNRLLIGNGERYEILVDLSAMLNDTVFLMSYGSEIPRGVMGADSVGDATNQVMDYYSNFLNGLDYNLLQINVGAQTASPVLTIPVALVPLTPIPAANAGVNRLFELDTLSEVFTQPNLAEGPFGINRVFFDMDSVNEVVYLNDTEIWTVYNKTMVAHPFHIHDVQFFILDINGGPVPVHEQGLKDVVLVMPGDSIRFITKFEDFADDSVPYMYHCHILHHEDDGMMGSFIVIDTTTSIGMNNRVNPEVKVYPDPAGDACTISVYSAVQTDATITLYNEFGQKVEDIYVGPLREGGNTVEFSTSEFSSGFYFLLVNGEVTQSSTKLIISH